MLLLSTVVWFFLFDINLNVEKKLLTAPACRLGMDVWILLVGYNEVSSSSSL
jgi:hypothetical protein